MTRAVEYARGHIADSHAFGFRHGRNILGRRYIEIDNSGFIARPDRDLVHISVRCKQEPAAWGNRENRERIGHGLGRQGCAFQRIKRDVDFRPFARADLFANIEHGSFVAFAFTNHHAALEINRVKGGPHGIDRGGISGFFIAAPCQSLCRDCGFLSYAHHGVRQMRNQNAFTHLTLPQATPDPALITL